MFSYNVLIIEDELDTANPVKGALELHEIAADIAPDGEKGLELLKKNPNKYDLILLDLKMPGMQGDEVLREIRRTDPYIYVVVYTNYGEYTNLKELVNIGIDKYINKGAGADLEELIDAIIGLLNPLTEEGIEALVKNTGEIPYME